MTDDLIHIWRFEPEQMWPICRAQSATHFTKRLRHVTCGDCLSIATTVLQLEDVQPAFRDAR